MFLSKQAEFTANSYYSNTHPFFKNVVARGGGGGHKHWIASKINATKRIVKASITYGDSKYTGVPHLEFWHVAKGESRGQVISTTQPGPFVKICSLISKTQHKTPLKWDKQKEGINCNYSPTHPTRCKQSCTIFKHPQMVPSTKITPLKFLKCHFL